MRTDDPPPWRRWLRSLGIALVVLVGGVASAFGLYTFDGPSMLPTMGTGDRFVVRSWGLDGLERGDLVVARLPIDGVEVVKRVVGLAGDVVSIEDGHLTIDGERLPKEPVGPCREHEGMREHVDGPFADLDCEVFRETLPGGGGEATHLLSHAPDYAMNMGPVTVPPGHVFLRGDHRDMSNDSTNVLLGPLPTSAIVGKVVWVYWRAH